MFGKQRNTQVGFIGIKLRVGAKGCYVGMSSLSSTPYGGPPVLPAPLSPICIRYLSAISYKTLRSVQSGMKEDHTRG